MLEQNNQQQGGSWLRPWSLAPCADTGIPRRTPAHAQQPRLRKGKLRLVKQEKNRLVKHFKSSTAESRRHTQLNPACAPAEKHYQGAWDLAEAMGPRPVCRHWHPTPHSGTRRTARPAETRNNIVSNTVGAWDDGRVGDSRHPTRHLGIPRGTRAWVNARHPQEGTRTTPPPAETRGNINLFSWARGSRGRQASRGTANHAPQA